jgi:hypothetical protein
VLLARSTDGTLPTVIMRAPLIFDSVHQSQGKGNVTHILLVADPQILNERSYPERNSLLRAASRIFVDMNLRKAWRVARSTRPQTVIFLGDMLDNGFTNMPISECVPKSNSLVTFTQLQVSRPM